jgi:hypothetical protein
MRRLGLLVLCLAIPAMAAIAPGTALALPNILPETELKSTGIGSEIELETVERSRVKCETHTGEYAIPAKTTLGTFKLMLTGCELKKPIEHSCTGTGDAPGTILSSGEVHLVWDSLTVLGLALLYLIPKGSTVFECSALVKVEVLGSVLCLLPTFGLKIKPTERVELICDQFIGVPEFTQYWNGSGVRQNVEKSLLTSFNGGAFEGSGIDGKATLKATTEYEMMA